MRQGSVLKTISSESAAVNRDICADWCQGQLQELLSSYEKQNIINVDKIRLFYKPLPSKTLVYKGKVYTGEKCNTEWTTVPANANMAADVRLKLMVAGKSEHPLCYTGIRGLPVAYNANGRV